MSSSNRRASKSADIDITPAESVQHRPRTKTLDQDAGPSSSRVQPGSEHGVPEYLGTNEASGGDLQPPEHSGMELLKERKRGYFKYLRTKEFYVVLLLGQILCIANTSSGTFTGLIFEKGTNIPAFQTLFTYILLTLIYTTLTIYKYGFKSWLRLLYTDGWRYFILAFFDVEGNYFTVKAYAYTNILSCQLINFWAIVIVVAISLIFLGVRYHLFQYIGILICIGGTGVLLASDHINHTNGGPYSLKGDLWALGGATFYGLDNVFQEFLVSKRPVYEVIGQLSFWAMFIIGVQAAIFDRASFQSATWNGAVAGYLTGYTLVLTLFYSLAPLMFRLSSAAFFNLSLLTGNFWGVLIGIQVFHLTIHWMYPIALVLIVIGHIAYFCTESVLGEARKPWLGEQQQKGVSGVGTARKQDEQGGLLGLGRSWGLWGSSVASMPRRSSMTVGAEGAGVV